MILATVPGDKAELVDPILQKGWYAPIPECVARINAATKRLCLVKNQCYVIDLHQVVENLNGPGIIFEDTLNKTFDLRFDGVHLSKKGIRYVTSLMDQALQDSPPACAK